MKCFFGTVLTLAISIGFASFASELNLDDNGLALSGYDPIEYLHDQHALKGFTDIETVMDGARYRFRSEENRALFVANPEKYLPAYGGWCPYGLAMDDSEYPRGKYPVNPKTCLNCFRLT